MNLINTQIQTTKYKTSVFLGQLYLWHHDFDWNVTSSDSPWDVLWPRVSLLSTWRVHHHHHHHPLGSFDSPPQWEWLVHERRPVSLPDSVFRRFHIAVISALMCPLKHAMWLIWWPISYHCSEPRDSTMTTILQPANQARALDGRKFVSPGAGGVEWVGG